MTSKTITVSTRMDYPILRAFSMFDTFLLRRRWVRPAMFGGIFVIFAVICFAATGKEQNVLLGMVMLLIGLGMPAVYVGMYLSGVKGQAKKLRLPRKAYTVRLNGEKIVITNEMKQEDDVTLEWGKMVRAFRVKNAVYLYPTTARAFILPNGQADASPDELWALIEENMPKGRAVNKRR